jgi:hypothetical protein
MYIIETSYVVLGSKVRRERTGHHAPSTKEGPSMSRKKIRKGHRSSIVRKRDFQTRGRKYHWMR